MRSCEEYRELISRLLDDDLSADEQRELERHAASCPDCAAMLAAFRSLSDVLSDDPAAPPEGLHENIMADVRRESIRRRQAPKRIRSLLALAACVALVLLAAANLPRMRAAAPLLSAAKASDSALPADMPAEAMIIADEAVATEETNGSAPSGALFGAVQEASADDGEPEAPAPVSEPAPEAAEAAGGAELPAAAQTEPEAAAVSPAPVWPYVLVGLLAVGGALLFLRGLRAKRR